MLIIFPLQQQLHQNPSMLRSVYVACPVLHSNDLWNILYNIQRWNRQNMAEQKQTNFTVMSLSLSYYFLIIVTPY